MSESELKALVTELEQRVANLEKPVSGGFDGRAFGREIVALVRNFVEQSLRPVAQCALQHEERLREAEQKLNQKDS